MPVIVELDEERVKVFCKSSLIPRSSHRWNVLHTYVCMYIAVNKIEAIRWKNEYFCIIQSNNSVRLFLYQKRYNASLVIRLLVNYPMGHFLWGRKVWLHCISMRVLTTTILHIHRWMSLHTCYFYISVLKKTGIYSLFANKLCIVHQAHAFMYFNLDLAKYLEIINVFSISL